MSKVLVSMPTPLLQALDRLVSAGFYASRSEAIRDGIRLLLETQEGAPDEEGESFVDFLSPMSGPRDISYS